MRTIAQALVWPFALLFQLVGGIFQYAARCVAILVGLVLLIVGVALTVTVIGAIVGIPLIRTSLTLIRGAIS
jgi:hypothetical protein